MLSLATTNPSWYLLVYAALAFTTQLADITALLLVSTCFQMQEQKIVMKSMSFGPHSPSHRYNCPAPLVWRHLLDGLLTLMFLPLVLMTSISTVFAAQPLGYLDAATATYVGGWAFDPDHPSAEVAIHVYVNGVFVTDGATTGFRPDVNAAFGIVGNHGYTLPVDFAALGPGDHSVVVYAIDFDGEGNPGLVGSPKVVTVTCTPQCAGKQCGANGCGGVCGTCGGGFQCQGDQCVCVPNCAGKSCGSDGCGGSCGSCGGGLSCTNGICLAAADQVAIGSLDVVTPGQIGGWAKDPDYDGPIAVHIYVDGVLFKALLAQDYRSDVGYHGFNWVPPPLGAGSHQVIVYAIGAVGNGAPSGQNPSLAGSPKTLTMGCQGLQSSALAWCQGMAPYWISRQSDTVFVGDDSVRIGINKSFGGTIFYLAGIGWEPNLILEHGGGAVQLSIWGYDPVGPVGWFGQTTCDPIGYPSLSACMASGQTSCVARAFSTGAHVSDCVTETPCTGWTAGAPWNPIQAQGKNCGWADAGNDVVVGSWVGSSYYTRHDKPFHFTSTQSAVPMPMEQWVEAKDGMATIKYRLTYSGGSAWSYHPQEIPAIFTAFGMDAHYYYYGGNAPFTGDSVTHKSGPPNSHLRFPGQSAYGHGEDYIGYAREGWWGVCDADQDRCITLAGFDDIYNEVSLSTNGSGEGYVTALGWFPVVPTMDLQWTLFMFPYRYDHVINGKTVRQRIAELAPQTFKNKTACMSPCGTKQCGPDGCGGTCGSCGPGTTCSANGVCQCAPQCGGKQCGPDGCGGTCGSCGPGTTCSGSGVCQCAPQCGGKQCGSDGCGGTCGMCVESPSCESPGDLDQNGEVTVVDVQCSLLTVLTVLGGTTNWPACLVEGPAWVDENCDMSLDVSDVVVTIGRALGQPLEPALDSDQDNCFDSCNTPDCMDGVCSVLGP